MTNRNRCLTLSKRRDIPDCIKLSPAIVSFASVSVSRNVMSQFTSKHWYTRLMFSGLIDQALSRKLKCKYQRKLANLCRVEERQCDENSCVNKSANNGSVDYVSLVQLQRNIRVTKPKRLVMIRMKYRISSTAENIVQHFNNKYRTKKTNKTTKRDLPALARACDRQFFRSVSDQAAAAIASADLQDCGLISPEESQNCVDKNKIR